MAEGKVSFVVVAYCGSVAGGHFASWLLFGHDMYIFLSSLLEYQVAVRAMVFVIPLD